MFRSNFLNRPQGARMFLVNVTEDDLKKLDRNMLEHFKCFKGTILD
jgi:hypothetical protein